MKDLFSDHASDYAFYRPTYPERLFTFLESLVTERGRCWDCGTGNGQVANRLSSSFDQVFATDISRDQLKQAKKNEQVIYSVQPAEKTDFPADYFDLIVVAQAVHWFDFNKFYKEVRRTSRPEAVLALIGYGLLTIDPQVDQIISTFYYEIIGPYWDPERKYLDEEYNTIPFPFSELPHPPFAIECDWTLEQFLGYLNTWSAVKHYIRAKLDNPVDQLKKELEFLWKPNEKKRLIFPLFSRIGKVVD